MLLLTVDPFLSPKPFEGAESPMKHCKHNKGVKGCKSEELMAEISPIIWDQVSNQEFMEYS